MALKIVVLDCPIDTWNEEQTRELFGAMVKLKLNGYGKEYRRGVLALDTSDFFGTHLMICDDQNGKLEPLCAYRSVTLDQCDLFRTTFPPLAIAKGAESEPHVRAVTEMMDEARREHKSIRYCAAYTIKPEARSNRELVSNIKNVLLGLHVNFLRSSKTDISMLCGAVKFKVDQMFESWGYVALQQYGDRLPNFHQYSLYGAEAVMFSISANGFNEFARDMGQRYRLMWQHRLEIRATTEMQQKKTA